MIFHFLFHLVKMFKSYFGVDYKAVCDAEVRI